jgi:hypothetical protein
LNYVPERAIATTLLRSVHHPLARIYIVVVTYNFSSFKKELNKGGTIGDHGIVIDVWVPKTSLVAGDLMWIESWVDNFGVIEKALDVELAVLNPRSWRITTRA